ncbi:AraC family transcriptional regulator [Blautia schinkii]|nr:AraC family transcriptional regulator [Blautia schinkii]
MKNKKDIEFRYYEIPQKAPLIALLGERWILNYGKESLHFHNFLEIGYCYFGEGQMIIEDDVREYREGTYTVIPRNFPHCTRSKDDMVNRWEYLFIDVDGFLKDVYKEKPMMAVRLIERIHKMPHFMDKETDPKMAEIICSILDEMRDKKEMYQENVKGLLLALLVEVARLNPVDTMRQQNSEQNMERIMRTLEYVGEHYMEQLRIEDLAHICHVSETHFRRLFEKVVNTTPMEYINLVRIQKACELLDKTEKTVEEIRSKVGFPTASTFNRNFKRLVGMAPGQWREQSGGRMVDYRISIYKGW